MCGLLKYQHQICKKNLYETNTSAIDLLPIFIVFLRVFLFSSGKSCFTNYNSKNNCSTEAPEQKCWANPGVYAILNLAVGKTISCINNIESLANRIISQGIDLENCSYLYANLKKQFH